MDKKINPVIVTSPVGATLFASTISGIKTQVLICDSKKSVSLFDPLENNVAIRFFNSADILPDCHTLGDDKLPMSQRSYGWYNKFSKNNIYKKR